MSRIVTTGKREPYGRPSAGCGDGGPVDALAAAEDVGAHDEAPVGVDRLAGPDRCRPTSPAPGGPGRPGPAAWLSPVQRVADETAFAPSASSGPTSRRRPPRRSARAAVECEPAVGGERKELAVTRLVAGPPGAGCGERGWGRHRAWSTLVTRTGRRSNDRTNVLISSRVPFRSRARRPIHGRVGCRRLCHDLPMTATAR